MSIIRILTAILSAAALLIGCATPSLHPLHSVEKEVFDDAIVGQWRGDDAPTYTVSRVGNHYRVVVKDNDAKEPKTWELEAKLVQLGQHRYADFRVNEGERRERAEKWGPLFLPTHMFARYAVSGDSLTLWMLSKEWLEKAVAAKKADLPTARLSEHELLITADTPSLQAFVMRYGADEAAFSNKTELRRVK